MSGHGDTANNTGGEPDIRSDEHMFRARCWLTLIRTAINVEHDDAAIDEDMIQEAVNLAAVEALEELDALRADGKAGTP